MVLVGNFFYKNRLSVHAGGLAEGDALIQTGTGPGKDADSQEGRPCYPSHVPQLSPFLCLGLSEPQALATKPQPYNSALLLTRQLMWREGAIHVNEC